MLYSTPERGNTRAHGKILTCLVMLALTCSVTLPAFGADQYKDESTLRDAAHVLDEMFKSNNIPPDLITKAVCVIVMPGVKKFGLGVGGSGGRGPMSCRKGANFKGKWSTPAMYTIASVSAGLQVGGSSTDYVLLVMDQKGLNEILKGKTKLGANVSASAGPGATTAGTPGGDILTYAHSTKGLFAGASLSGASIEEDHDANTRLYGQSVAAQSIVKGNTVKTTDAGQPLVTLLNSKT